MIKAFTKFAVTCLYILMATPLLTIFKVQAETAAEPYRVGPAGLTLPPINAQSGLVIGDQLFFNAIDAEHGMELWVTGNSQDGAHVIDINIGPANSGPGSFAAMGNELYFRANTSSIARLYKSDGNSATLVSNVPENPGRLKYFNNAIYFVDNIVDTPTGAPKLWKTDGTGAGTVAVNHAGISDAKFFTVVGTNLFFQANNDELWKTDGNTTVKVKDINSEMSNLAAVGNTLYFAAGISGGQKRFELWKSDGTELGTTTVKVFTIFPGVPNTLDNLTNFNGTLFFTAYTGEHDNELWKSNGTNAGTQRVKDINPGAQGSQPTNLRVMGGVLYFSAFEPTHDRELWRSDGIPSSTETHMVRNINPGSENSRPARLFPYGGNLYFEATGPSGQQLWVSDGTYTGTRQVTNFPAGRVPGQGESLDVLSLGGIGTTLYFSANDGVNGRQLWAQNTTQLPAWKVVYLPYVDD